MFMGKEKYLIFSPIKNTVRDLHMNCSMMCSVKATGFCFEGLGQSLYDFLRKNNYHPFPIDIVRELGKQLLESVAYMHHLHLIHTDLKHENIRFFIFRVQEGSILQEWLEEVFTRWNVLHEISKVNCNKTY